MNLNWRRLIRSAKWAGIVTLILVIGIDVASSTWRYVVTSGPFVFSLHDGGIGLAEKSDGTPWRGTQGFARGTGTRYWLIRYQRATPGQPMSNLFIPIWMLSLPVALLAAGLWCADRRRFPTGHCSACGYDLSATVDRSPCPECGARSKASRSPGNSVDSLREAASRVDSVHLGCEVVRVGRNRGNYSDCNCKRVVPLGDLVNRSIRLRQIGRDWRRNLDTAPSKASRISDLGKYPTL